MKNTTIGWPDHTCNPWLGCTKVSPGCEHCYAETWGLRFGVAWGPGQPRKRTSAAYWRQPLAWNRAAAPDTTLEHPWFPPRPRVFCGSLMDWLDPEVPVEWLADLLNLIRRTPNLDWLLLTKRPQNWAKRLCDVIAYLAMKSNAGGDTAVWCYKWRIHGEAPPNIWVGTTVEDQQRADERIPELLQIPAKVRFLSVEPMLGPVNLDKAFMCRTGRVVRMRQEMGIEQAISWVICGGESGPHARPMHPDWARSLRGQCNAAGVPFFYKQAGGYYKGGSLLDGREWKEFPR